MWDLVYIENHYYKVYLQLVKKSLLIQDAQASLVEKQLESLMVERKLQAEDGFPERVIITVGGRQQKHLKVAYDQVELPVLPPDHELARLYLQEAHERDHAGVDAMIMRSRSQVWITRVRPKAQAIKKACFTCRRRAKELGSQRGVNARLRYKYNHRGRNQYTRRFPLPVKNSVNSDSTQRAPLLSLGVFGGH